MLAYERTGTGHPLVLIHGFLGSANVFADVLPALQKHFDVIAIELPGHGNSAVEQDAYTVYSYAEEIARVLEKEQVTHTHVLGHSLGGYIALAAYEKNILPIHKIVLAYTSEKADGDEAKEKRTKQQQQIRDEGVDAYVDSLIENFFAPNTDAAIIEKGRVEAKRAQAEGLIKALDAMKARPDQTELLPTIDVPVLVIEGSEDGVVKPIETDNPQFEKATTTTGHLGMIEDADAFSDAVIAFLQK